MKRPGNKGITLLELIIGMAIGSLVIGGAYRLQIDISRGVDREAGKSLVQSDLITVTEFIERDIRLAGYSLPGNGITKTINNNVEELRIFTNVDKLSTFATNQVNTGGTQISVLSTDGFSTGGWICVETGGSVRYHQITGINTVSNVIEIANGVGDIITTGKTVYKADCVTYHINNRILYRKLAANEYRISDKIDSLGLIARNEFGDEITTDFSQARTVSIILGGIVKSGGVEHMVTESTQVSIRNAGAL